MPASTDLLPHPFQWVAIPDKDYSIAKYPVTNAQFSMFIDAGGYENRTWWMQQGWRAIKELNLIEPRKWRDEKFMGDEKPVIVIWYEAIAFCRWLSEQTSENITLPTEEQWQYAAQGNDGRVYPWGDRWDEEKCHTAIRFVKPDRTCSVTAYEGKGDSAFGIVGMIGNVSEWCLTDYDNKTNNPNSDAKYRSLRGGDWKSTGSVHHDAPSDILKKYRENPQAFYPNCSERTGLAPGKIYAPTTGFRIVSL